MATQHPDSASRKVSVREEPNEAVECCRKDGLGCDEYLVDYMGKLTPYHQIGQIIKRIIEETDLVPGKDIYITPRMVSSFREEPFRQLMTTFAIAEGIYYCYKKYGEQGITFIVQALTSTLEELKSCRERSEGILKLAGKHLGIDTAHMFFRMIPLFGGIAEHLSIRQNLPKLIEGLGVGDFFRVFIAKSEASLLYGHMASVLSCKLAIADCYKVEASSGIKIYPILGIGALPFRGHLTLTNVTNILKEYEGVSTYTIQSGLRYDHGTGKTKSLIDKLRSHTQSKHLDFSDEDYEKIRESIFIFAKNYLIELVEIQDLISRISSFIPEQRERLLDFEEVSYYRELRNIQNILMHCKSGDVKRSLIEFTQKTFKKPPRWFKFVASTYTCGLPPEFIGTGRALEEIKELMGSKWVERLLEEIYPTLREDISYASKFLNVDPDRNILLTDKIMEGIEMLKGYFDFEEADLSYQILCDVANSYLKEIIYGKSTKRKKLAILISEGEIAEYLNGASEENLARVILDMGKIRGSLA